jgi:hypothetical protein
MVLPDRPFFEFGAVAESMPKVFMENNAEIWVSIAEIWVETSQER